MADLPPIYLVTCIDKGKDEVLYCGPDRTEARCAFHRSRFLDREDHMSTNIQPVWTRLTTMRVVTT